MILDVAINMILCTRIFAHLKSAHQKIICTFAHMHICTSQNYVIS